MITLLCATGSSRADSGTRARKLGGWRKVVVASAADGFAAVLSCAEVFQEMGNTQALVGWEIDGEPAQSVYSLNKIEAVDLSSHVP